MNLFSPSHTLFLCHDGGDPDLYGDRCPLLWKGNYHRINPSDGRARG